MHIKQTYNSAKRMLLISIGLLAGGLLFVAPHVLAADPALTACSGLGANTIVSSCLAGYNDPNTDCSKQISKPDCEKGKQLKTQASQQQAPAPSQTTGEAGFITMCKASGKSDQDCQAALTTNKEGCQQQVNNNTYKNMDDCLNHRATYNYGVCDDGSKPSISTGKCANGDDAKAPGTQNGNNNGVNGQPANNSTNVSANGGKCGGASTAIIDCSDKKGEEAITELLKQFVTILSVGVGIVAVGGIVWGAILYSSARDNAGQTQQAIGVIRNTVIGIVLYVFMVSIVNWLVPGGVIG